MAKIAFVFAGQGAQYSGMGQDLAQRDAEAARVFAQADAQRAGTSRQCFTGDMDELSQTANTQPCMYAMEMAAAQALTAAGVRPQMLAGFSVGEIAALTCSGAVDFQDGFELVCNRGRLMQEASQQADTAMTAVLKLSSQQVEELCGQYDQVYPVNYNCPGQTVVAGLKSALDAFKYSVKQAGGRAMPLPVSGAFHTPFMAEAAQGLRRVLSRIRLRTTKIPLYSDYSGQPYAGDYRELLCQQLCHPVRWQHIIEDMIADGADTFIEIGPGDTLSRFINRINASVRTFQVEDGDSLSVTCQRVLADA